MTGVASVPSAQHPSRILLQCCSYWIEVESRVNRRRAHLGMIQCSPNEAAGSPHLLQAKIPTSALDHVFAHRSIRPVHESASTLW